MGEILTQATLELYNAVAARFLPTPAKTHYLFNLRDISKVHSNKWRGKYGADTHSINICTVTIYDDM